MTRFKKYLLTFLKGIGMGGADIVPGVSGGSIALITGIYEELLDSIKSIDLESLHLLRQGKFKLFWRHINGTFLLVLLLGILTSIFTLSKLITYLISEHPIPVWSFFCGLIIISAIIILRDIRNWSILALLGIPVGAILAYFVTELPPMSSPDSLFLVFLSGAVAICAMILPGISGGIILLIMGKYEYILNAVTQKDLLVITVFGLGCIIGLLSFSRLISWLLKNYHSISIAVLSGFMLGSINKIWPWKKVLSYRISSSGVQKPFITENMWPHHYLNETGQESMFFVAIFTFLMGVILVVGIERLAYYLKKQ